MRLSEIAANLLPGWRPTRSRVGALEDYYRVKAHTPIKLIIRKYAEGKKVREDSMPVWYTVDEIWRYREYDWTRETARSGIAKVGGKLVDLPGPVKWDALVLDMKAHGWDAKDPLHMGVTKNRAMVNEGNHRLAIAREARILVPVMFHFGDYLRLPARAKTRKEEERQDDLRLKEMSPATVEKAIEQAPDTPLSEKDEALVQELMDLLF